MTRPLYKEYSETRQNDRFFSMYAGDQKAESFDVDKVEIPIWSLRGQTADEVKGKMKDFLKKKNAGTVMTKSLFGEYLADQRAAREAREKERESGDNKSGTDGKTDKTDSKTDKEREADLEQKARESFKRHDTNSDGFLDEEEMKTAARSGSRIFDEREKYDKDKNNKIDVNEYVEYFKARFTRGGNRGGQGKDKGDNQGADNSKPPEVEDVRPIVYRLGKMPKELPSWFETMDKDKDGQVGLYEWKMEGSKSVKEFMEMDLNQDGFVTVEEALRYQKAQDALKDKDQKGTYAALTGPQPAQTVALVTVGGGGNNPGGRMGGRMGMGGGKMGMGGGKMGKMGGKMGKMGRPGQGEGGSDQGKTEGGSPRQGKGKNRFGG